MIAVLGLAGLLALGGTTASQPGSRDSLSLADALALARARNPDLRAALAAARRAAAQRDVASAARVPRLSAQAVYLRYQDAPAVAFGPGVTYGPFEEDNYFAWLAVTQPLFTSGRLSNAMRAAEGFAQAAQWSQEHAAVELTAAVAHGFDDVLLARALRDVAVQAVAVLEEAVRVAREHYAAGVAARLDVLRAETRLSSAIAALRARETALVAAREALAVLIGAEPASLPPLAGSLEESAPVVAVDTVSAGVPAARADIRALEASAAALRAQARVARAARWPALSAFVSVLGSRPEFVTGERRAAVDLLGGLSLSWPFFDGGASAAGGRAADAAADLHLAQRDAILAAAAAALRVNAQVLAAAAEDIREGRANVERAERALTIAQDRYRNGVGIQLEVLEAEADVTRARGDLLRARHASRAALVELRRAAGVAAGAPSVERGGGP